MSLRSVCSRRHVSVVLGVLLGVVLCENGQSADTPVRLHWTALNEPGSGGAITALAVSPHDPQRVLVGGDMLGIGVSENRGDEWLPASGLPSYEIGEFTFHPRDAQVVWAGTMSGPCVSRDGGRTWRWSRDGFPSVGWGHYSAPVQKIVYDPQRAGRLLAFGGSRRRWASPDAGPNSKSVWAVWESVDDGAKWQELSRIDGVADVMAVGFGPGTASPLYAALHDRGVWMSSDAGRTWNRRSDGLSTLSVNALAIDPKQAGRLWASVGGKNGGVFVTSDSGKSWSRLALPGENFSAIALCATKPTTLYACEFGWQGGTIFISDDAGVTWRASLQNPVFQRAYAAGAQMSVVAVDPRDPLTAFAGNTETVVRTTDGGRTWSDSTSERVGTDAWRGRGYSGLCAIRFRFNPEMPGHAALVAMDNGNLWQSHDDLRSWTWGGGERFPTWGKVQDLAFAGNAGKTMYLALESSGLGVVARTTDGGHQWRACGNRGLNTDKVITIVARPAAPDVVWVADQGGRVCLSLDAGESWNTVLDAGIVTLEPFPAKGKTILAGGKQGLFEAADGKSFVAVPGSPLGITAIAIGGGDQPTLLVATDKAIWRRVDTTWSKLAERERIGQVVIDPRDARRLAFTTSDDPYHDQTRATGVWLSQDGGVTWTQENAGLPMLRGGVLALDPHDPSRLVLGTNGRGYFVARWP